MSNVLNPLISVIVPLYNKEPFVERCLDSVLSQTYGDFELLVIDDGSTDGSRKRVLEREDPRIRLIAKPNGGVSSARNLGMREAKGEYVAFLDADDAWYAGHLEVLVQGADRYPDAAILSNTLVYHWSQYEVPESEAPDLSAVSWQEEHYLHSLSQGKFPIHIGSILFRHALLKEKKIIFCESMRLAEDVNFMLRLSRLGHCMLSDYVGLVYHQDDQQSAMKQSESLPARVPHYFEGMDEVSWSEEERGYIRKFLLREYLKKAYQNRHLPLRREEISTQVGGGKTRTWRWGVLPYLLIRYLPEAIFWTYRRLKPSDSF